MQEGEASARPGNLPPSIGTSWRAFHELRREVRRRWPSVWHIPLERRATDVVRRHCRGRRRCLEIGGSERSWERRRSRFPDLDVETMNVDPAESCDHRSLEEARGPYDLVLMLETLEHLTMEEGAETLRRARELLSPEGRIVVSTPNLHHPNRFWDPTHLTPWRYDDLGALLRATGYDLLELWRLHNEAALPRVLRRTLGVWLHRYLDVDFARSIAAVGAPSGPPS